MCGSIYGLCEEFDGFSDCTRGCGKQSAQRLTLRETLRKQRSILSSGSRKLTLLRFERGPRHAPPREFAMVEVRLYVG